MTTLESPMHGVLNKNLFLVKSVGGIIRAANYDIYDPETGHIIMECREKRLGIVTKIFRCIDLKRMTPFDIQVRSPNGHQIVRVTKGISFFLSFSEMNVLDENDRRIGGIKKVKFLGEDFSVFDTRGRPVCRLEVEKRKPFPLVFGEWIGCDFKFMADETELAHVTKNWEGIGKGPANSLDNCVLEIADSMARHNVVRQLILAAVMCIDMVRPIDMPWIE